jgi:hypothetical protein
MIVLRDPQNGKYISEQTISEGIVIPLAFSDIQVSIDKLLS